MKTEGIKQEKTLLKDEYLKKMNRRKNKSFKECSFTGG